jgi:uncharacterized integral membrane protein
MITILACVIIIGICTLTALGVTVYSHFGYSREAGDGWFVIIVAGMILMLGTIITLCNTTSWK